MLSRSQLRTRAALRMSIWLLFGLCTLLSAACRHQEVSLQGGCDAGEPSWVKLPSELSRGRVTFCHDDAYTGRIESESFPAGTASVDLMVAGFPDNDKVRLEAIYKDGLKVARLSLPRVGDEWRLIRLSIPARVQKTAFRLRLVDQAEGMYGWAGIGESRPWPWLPALGFASVLFGVILFCHAWLCCVAFALPRTLTAASRVAAAMLVLGASSFATFLLYLVGPRTGYVSSLFVAALPFAVAALALGRRTRPRSDFAPLHLCLLPTLALALAILWVGLFPFAWDGTTWTVPALRWRDMPIDNWLSFYFADMLSQGVLHKPMLADWLSSDRPPLQTGMFLIFKPLMASYPGLVYQASATWAQALLLFPLALLLPRSLTNLQRASILFLLGTSALVFLNGLFVWPKLFAGSFCALYHLLLFADAPAANSSSKWQAARRDWAAGAAAGFVLLTHGGAICALFGSTLAWLLIRRRGVLKPLLRIAPVTAALLVPWILYQRLVDPPGDRLLKWHFAGQIPVTPEPFAQTFVHAYSTLSFSAWVRNRVANVLNIFDGSLGFFHDGWTLLSSPDGPASKDALHQMIEGSFLLPAYGAWFFGPLLLVLVLAYGAATRRLRGLVFAPGLLLATALGLLVWSFVMFLPASTIVHQGAYFTIAAMPLIVMLATAQLTPRLFRLVLLLQFAAFLILYVVDRPFGEVARPWVYLLGSAAVLAAFWRACELSVRSDAGAVA